MHLLLVEARGEQLDVASPAVDALLVLDGELDDERLTLVAEVVEAVRGSVEAGVLARLQTCGEREESQRHASALTKTSFTAERRPVVMMSCAVRSWRCSTGSE